MDLLSGLRKGDTSRGGRAEFSWEAVKDDKDRENYLGHSLMAPVGRWQRNKDLTWYSKASADNTSTQQQQQQTAEEQRREEIQRIKEAEQDALAAALGYPVQPRPTENVDQKDVQRAIKESRGGDDDGEGEGEGVGIGFGRGGRRGGGYEGGGGARVTAVSDMERDEGRILDAEPAASTALALVAVRDGGDDGHSQTKPREKDVDRVGRRGRERRHRSRLRSRDRDRDREHRDRHHRRRSHSRRRDHRHHDSRDERDKHHHHHQRHHHHRSHRDERRRSSRSRSRSRSRSVRRDRERDSRRR